MTRQPSWLVESPQFSFVYVSEITTNAPPAALRLTVAADGGSSAVDGAVSVADDGFQRSLKRHVADVKHIVGDDQATLMVDRTFVYVRKIATNALATALWLTAADGDCSNFMLPPLKTSPAVARR